MGRRKLRVIVLGAGFGGLELSSILSERMGDFLDLTLIDKSDSFFFGFNKLEVMFGRRTSDSVKLPYARIRKPGVTFRRENILAIDPEKRRVSTTGGTYEADVLVVALGADYDIAATPGLSEVGNEFYSFTGAEQIGKILPGFDAGHIIVGVTGFPFKCPPAPSETALLLHEYLRRKGVRGKCHISLVLPFELPVPPSYGTSRALLKAFGERDIDYVPEMMVGALDPAKKLAILDDGNELPFDLFLGIPEHCVPKILDDSGLLLHDWIPVDKQNLKTNFPGVYAIGDVTSVGVPKAGMFAEGAARTAAESIIAEFNGAELNENYNGEGACYIEFGEGKVARADVGFFAGNSPTGVHHDASETLAAEKKTYEASKTAQWFGV